VRLIRPEDKVWTRYPWAHYIGVKGKARIYGDTIAEVMDAIAWHEGETP
jgi:hypothetical protein